LALLAAGAAVALPLAACAPGAEYPAVLDRPEPRADAPMSPDQLKEVTNSLISDRDHLSAEAKPQADTPAAKPTVQASSPARKHSRAATTGSAPAAGTSPQP
jgi:hypothetical protein